ncbi:PilZ domain-containing protein [Sandaracinus amylolyticus]|uniref:PilZ domain-containing protein n=1 Tax=Sandaracinus amylolyticus TaxID=927083 RepID=UPI001F32E208|nr:PilZ domain-containing protein [Sandaracinus amylolyticus]UJR87033.1 Hypothetical protein I5071_91340 [Sandaracinus amylolyticus]
MSSGRRVHERYALALDVTLKHPDGESAGLTQNVSLGGALIEIKDRITFGAEVRLRLRLPPLKEDAEIPAIVRWIKDGLVGIQFGSLRAKEVWAFNQMFKDAPKV